MLSLFDVPLFKLLCVSAHCIPSVGVEHPWAVAKAVEGALPPTNQLTMQSALSAVAVC